MKRRRIGKLSLSKQKLKTSHTIATPTASSSSSTGGLRSHLCQKPIALSTAIETQPQDAPLSITTTTSTNKEETLHAKKVQETDDVDVQKIVQAMDMISYDMVALDEGKIMLKDDQLFPQSISIFCAHHDADMDSRRASKSICIASNGLIDLSSMVS